MSGLRERMNRLLGAAAPRQADPSQELKEAIDVTSAARSEALNETGNPADRRMLLVDTPEPDGRSESERKDAGGLVASDEAAGLEPGWAELGVEALAYEGESFLRRRLVYPLQHRHGDQQLSELHDVVSELVAFHPSLPSPSADEILFLDLETTGLGAGTGTIPFMVGIGYAEKERFVIEQLFIRHPAEERAMLGYLHGWLESRRYLATYNGKTFDWPALTGRYVMHGHRDELPVPLHLDFLHPSRSIWRHTLDSCKLSRVEEARLGIRREDDVPGSMAPALYYQYLADGQPQPLEAVFRHNEIDMLSLAALAIRYGRLLGGGLGSELPYPEQPEELLRTGLWLERMGRTEDAESIYERLMDQGHRPGAWCLPLAARDKKIGNWGRAVVLWQKAAQAAEEASSHVTEAHIELAMYHEHKTKDLPQALHYAKLAFAMSGSRGDARKGPKQQDREVIRKRVERLLTKVERNKKR
ncbi:ribonuclease H-like domain-containing protein [Paenibacillus sp. 1P07SE]|uniref:ribonuclease H-like domain-containing protein n=1 Tax=Paenibacillus sp. 1P07SE TaxID=3132209 RepID=UPI0039A4676B